MIERRTLREQVREELLRRIGDHRLKPGERLEEARLIEELGVGRTPVREALISLEREGLVESIANRGFSVTTHSIEQVRQLYPIMAALETLAVRTSTKPPAEHADELDSIRARIVGARNSRHRYAADLAWHQELVSGTPNTELRDEIERVRRRTQLYDGAWERGMANLESSLRDHDAITAMIRAGRLAEAAVELDQHWINGAVIVTAWIQSKEDL